MEPKQEQYNNDYPQVLLPDETPINWQKYIFLFLNNWIWFLVLILIAISLAYVKNRYALPTYRANATIMIEDEDAASDIMNEIRSVKRSRRRSDMANELAKLNEFSLHARTVDSLGWKIFWTGHGRVARIRPLYNTPPYYIEVDPTSEPWYYNQEFFLEQTDEKSLRFHNDNGIDKSITLDSWNEVSGWKFRVTRSEFGMSYESYSFTFPSPYALTLQYLSKVSYQADEELGTVITMSSQGLLPQKEMDYLNMLCETYITAGLERKRLIAESTLDFLDEQLGIVRDSLLKTEKQLLDFRIQNGVVDLSQEGQQDYEKLFLFFDQRNQLNLKQGYYEYLREYIISKRDPQEIISPALVGDGEQFLLEEVKNLQLLYSEREILELSASLENPSIININLRIQTARIKILEIIDGLIENNQIAEERIKSEENQIEAQLLLLPLNEQELLNIQRKYEVNNQFYTFLLEKRAEAGIQKASTVSNVRIINSAGPHNLTASSTKKSQIYLIAFVLAFIIPYGILLIIELLDNRIKDRSDIERKTKLPILGIVSHDNTEEKIPVFAKPGSAFAESFRHIRTNLNYILREPNKKIIMVSSTISGEGKTFIAVNLSTIMAMNNKKVLLCGFDLRRPSLHRIFNIDNSQGVTTYITGVSNYEDIIHKTNIPGMDVMLAGPVPPNPAELLETDLITSLFEKAQKTYDYIIVDTPPVALVTDALLISKHADSTVFILRQNYTPKDVLEFVNDLGDEKITSISLIINDIKESKALGYRYYYGYGYSYSYHYKYGNSYYQENT